jgi:hypothetical protein
VADNIDVQPGERPGKVAVVTDEIDGVHHPLYKIEYGADGEATQVDSDNPLPVDQSATDELHETAVYLKESIDDLLIEQRLTNEYLSHILGEDLRECEDK